MAGAQLPTQRRRDLDLASVRSRANAAGLLTYGALAKGLAPSTVRQVMNNTMIAGPRIVGGLAQVLGCAPVDILQR